ncbi:hypothetical protein ACFQ3Z_38495 [Streptomyces nogalater]
MWDRRARERAARSAAAPGIVESAVRGRPQRKRRAGRRGLGRGAEPARRGRRLAGQAPCGVDARRAGVGYPLAALLAELGGVRAAYGLGLAVTAAALLTAWRSMPEAPEGRSAHVDVAGAVVLAAALLLVLFLAGERNLWSRHLAVGRASPSPRWYCSASGPSSSRAARRP